MLTNEDLLTSLVRCVDRPVSEVFAPGFEFSDYRLSYGVHSHEPTTVYFLAIYPAFCLNPKAVFHYNRLDDLRQDLNVILDFTSQVVEPLRDNRKVQTRDVVAAVFALSRNKESVELFQEQKDFMELGVRHVHLDNYYQDFIRQLCQEYFKTGELLGSYLRLSFISCQEPQKQGQ